jgi:hypothetical protein
MTVIDIELLRRPGDIGSVRRELETLADARLRCPLTAAENARYHSLAIRELDLLALARTSGGRSGAYG